MRDPFAIEGPAAISFSGGRTSAYMLSRILRAHDGKLPNDVLVLFANTGKELPETLDFVAECGRRWGVDVTWLEYRHREGAHEFKVVDWTTASRNGEPFEHAIRARRMLPNPRIRFCTVELKVRTMHRYLKSLGWTEWTSLVGIRADEPRRFAKIGNQDEGSYEVRRAPLGEAGVAVAEVGAFWAAQPFDLGLPNMNGRTMHGNCDLCFLKGGKQLLALVREQPERAVWWMKMEQYAKDTFVDKLSADSWRFRNDRPSYGQMQKMALDHGELFKFDDEALQDCVCVD